MFVLLKRKSHALMRKNLFLISVFLFVPFGSIAQYDFNAGCRNAYVQILNFQFDSAQKILEEERKLDPQNLIPVYLENYIDFFTLFTSENNLLFEQAKRNKSRRLNLLERGDKNSPFYRFCIAGVKLQWALTRVKFGEYTTAAFEVRSAYLNLKENRDLYPEFLPDYVGLGLLHVIFGLIPEQYRWLARLASLDGSISGGMQELYRVMEYSGKDPVYRLFKPEAIFYLAFIDINILHNKASSLALIDRFNQDSVFKQYQYSPLLVFAEASILLKANKNEEVLTLLSGYEQPEGSFPMTYLSYQLGLARLQKLDLLASEEFSYFLKHFDGINYIKSAHQKLAWCNLLEGDTASYLKDIQLAGTKGNAIVDEDKQAHSEYNVGVLPASTLLQARLLYDGGYYDDALRVLLHTSLDDYIRSRKDLTEFTYRQARIYHGMGDTARAIEYYQKTIHTGRKIPHYFAANAALQLGLIYESQQNWVGADTNYRLCAGLKHDEYENSLRQKAKAGLNRISKFQD
jgi:hypothetical protein